MYVSQLERLSRKRLYPAKNFGQIFSETCPVQSPNLSENNLKFVRLNLEFVRSKKGDSEESPNQSEICPQLKIGNYFRQSQNEKSSG